MNLYKMDDLEQYNRRENLKIYSIPESSNNKDDVEDTRAGEREPKPEPSKFLLAPAPNSIFFYI